MSIGISNHVTIVVLKLVTVLFMHIPIGSSTVCFGE